MDKSKLLFLVSAAALCVAAAGQRANAGEKGAVRPGVPPALSTAPFTLTFAEQPPVNYVPNSKFTKPASNTQEYNYADLPDAARAAGAAGKEKSCARFVRSFSYGAMDAASAESCAKGCEEIYKHDSGVGANLPLECKFKGRSVYVSPKQKPADTPAQIEAARAGLFTQDGYHQILQADLTENAKGWVVFLRIKGNRTARYNLSIPAELGGCAKGAWIEFPNVQPKAVELRPGESTITLEMPADALKDKILKALASKSVDPASCKTAAFIAQLTADLPAESPYIGWTWLASNMSFTVPVNRFVGK